MAHSLVEIAMVLLALTFGMKLGIIVAAAYYVGRSK